MFSFPVYFHFSFKSRFSFSFSPLFFVSIFLLRQSFSFLSFFVFLYYLFLFFIVFFFFKSMIFTKLSFACNLVHTRRLSLNYFPLFFYFSFIFIKMQMIIYFDLFRFMTWIQIDLREASSFTNRTFVCFLFFFSKTHGLLKRIKNVMLNKHKISLDFFLFHFVYQTYGTNWCRPRLNLSWGDKEFHVVRKTSIEDDKYLIYDANKVM